MRYEAVNAMLLNEFLKEHRKVEELKIHLSGNEPCANFGPHCRLKAQAAQIQKVSDQLRTQVVAPLVVADN